MQQTQPALLPAPEGLVLTRHEWTHWTREAHPIEGCRVCQHVRRCVLAAQAARTDPIVQRPRCVEA